MNQAVNQGALDQAIAILKNAKDIIKQVELLNDRRSHKYYEEIQKHFTNLIKKGAYSVALQYLENGLSPKLFTSIILDFCPEGPGTTLGKELFQAGFSKYYTPIQKDGRWKGYRGGDWNTEW